MDRQRLLNNLEQANRNIRELQQARQWLLSALAQGLKTRSGESQDAKLETIDRTLRQNMRVKLDVEAILASEHGIHFNN